MPYAPTDDGVNLYFEAAGRGEPIVFVHEFAGDCRTWEPQLRYFARRYRCIAFNARGYPPSDVPTEDARYSQARARDDIKAVMDCLDLERAHIVGHSMGAFAALHLGIAYPARARSLVLAGCGYGAKPSERANFLAFTQQVGEMFRAGIAEAAAKYATYPGRLQFRAKDPRGYAEFVRMLAEHSAEGSALTMLNVQRLRPSLWDMETELKALAVPTLVLTGDEDAPCLDAGSYLKRALPKAGLAVIPQAGHTINSEEPEAFNRLVEDFLVAAEAGRWPPMVG